MSRPYDKVIQFLLISPEIEGVDATSGLYTCGPIEVGKTHLHSNEHFIEKVPAAALRGLFVLSGN